jgi:hypothetical protein
MAFSTSYRALSFRALFSQTSRSGDDHIKYFFEGFLVTLEGELRYFPKMFGGLPSGGISRQASDTSLAMSVV